MVERMLWPFRCTVVRWNDLPGAFTRVSAGGENKQDLVNANEDHG